jgi:HEAT repeat protein
MATPPGRLREIAKRGLGDLLKSNVNSLASLLSLIENRSAPCRLRCTASWLAARLGRKAVASSLLVAFHDADPILTKQTASDLSLLRAKRVLPALVRDLLSAPERQVREGAAYALRGYLFERPVDKRVLKALVKVLDNRDEHPAVRGQAAESLSFSFNKRMCKPLMRALADPSAEVRFWVAFALGQIGCRESIPHLRRLARTDRRRVPGWWTVRREAVDAITAIESRPRNSPRTKQAG